MAAIADRDSAKDLRGAGWDWTSKKAEQQREREKAADDVITDLGLVRKLSNALPKRQNSTRKSQSSDETRVNHSFPRRQASTRRSQSGVLQPIPVGSNPRILCLDGGGIRGIVQLEVLRGIERALGDRIALQAFFDLVIGSGFGGLLAMSLGMRGQTVEACIEQFKSTCDRAFKPKVKAVPGLKSISAALGNTQLYREKQLHDALKVAFGEKDSLLGSQTSFNTTNRIAVLSAHGTDQEAFVMSNYRQPKTAPGNELADSPEQDKEMKIWESVAAATADPAYYPPFELNGQTYIDGGSKCGNPASKAEQERKKLWPENEDPDLFLSLGTGQNRLAVLKGTSKNASSGEETTSSENSRPTRRLSRRWSTRKDEGVLDAEFAWTKFKGKIVRDRTEEKADRYVRLNPDLGKSPPAPDSRHDMESLQSNVGKWLQHPGRIKALRNIAHRLVASSFYLDSRSTVTDEQGEQVFSGTIACRFKYGSDQLRALGRVLQDRMTDGFEPYFLIKPDATSKYQSTTVKLTKEIVRATAERGIFALPGISIPINDASKTSTLNLFLAPKDDLEPEGFPISGFPNILLEKQTQTSKLPRRPRALSEQSLPHFSHSRATSLSRANSTTAVPASRKRATYSPSSTASPGVQRSSSTRLPGSHSKRLSIQEIIAEEQSGAFVERRSSQYWSYIGKGNNNSSSIPEHATPETPSWNRRPDSLVMDVNPFDDAFEDSAMWSPLEGKDMGFASTGAYRYSPGDVGAG